MKTLIKRVGRCTFQPGGEPFLLLVRAIISQMISTSAAKCVLGRLETVLGAAGVTPAGVLALEEEALRGCGLSRNKTTAIRHLAELIDSGRLDVSRLAELEDEEVTARLVALPGIGPWTVQMFLMFGLGRLNVLPVGDFGLRTAVQEHYGLEQLPTPAQLRATATAWLPYCTIATWYLWRSRGWVPQSG